MKKIKVIFYKLIYGLPFEPGYSYRKYSSSNLKLMEVADFLLCGEGYERYTEIKCGLTRAYIWYRKKITTNSVPYVFEMGERDDVILL